MSISTAFDGYGVIIGVGDGASAEAFTDIAEVIDVNGPGYSKDVIDVSHASSPDKYREKIAGFIDAGEVTLTANMTQSDFASLLALLEAEALNNYKLTIPDDNFSTLPTIVFAAHITSLSSPIPTQDKVTMDVTFTISGKPVYTQGS